MSATEGAFMRLRSTGKKVPRSLSPKVAAKTEGRFLRFIFNNKGTAGEDCKICKPFDGHVWEVLAKNRPIIPRLEPNKRSAEGRVWTHPHCECRWAEVFADEAFAYEVSRDEWENSTIQGKQQQLELVGGPIEMANRSWATLPFALRQRLERLTADTKDSQILSDKNLNTTTGIEKSMSWNEATVNQKFTILLDRGIPFQEAHFASKLPAQEAAVVLGSDGNSSTDLLNDLLQGNIPNTRFMIDVQTPATQGFHPGGVEVNEPLPLEPADDDPAGREKPDGLMEQAEEPLEPTTTSGDGTDRRICPDDMVLEGEDCVPKNSDLVLTEGSNMYEKGLSYEQGVNDPLPLEPTDDSPAGRDEPDGLMDDGGRGDGLNQGKKNLTTSDEQTDDDEDEPDDDDEARVAPRGVRNDPKDFPPKKKDEDADEQGLNDDKKDLNESALTKYFRKQLGETKVRGREMPPCEPGSLLNPDSGQCEPVVDVDNGMDEAGTIVEPGGTDETPLTFGAATDLGDPTDAPLDIPSNDFPEETGMDLQLDEQQNGVMDDTDQCGPNQIKDSLGNCVEKQAEQTDSDNFTETWATEADVCRCGEKAWNSAYEVYGANVPGIILSKLPDVLGGYLLTDDKRRRLAGLEFSKLPPEIQAGALNLLQEYPAIIKKKALK